MEFTNAVIFQINKQLMIVIVKKCFNRVTTVGKLSFITVNSKNQIIMQYHKERGATKINLTLPPPSAISYSKVFFSTSNWKT